MDVSPIKERGTRASMSCKKERRDILKDKLGSIPSFLPMENIVTPTNQDVLCGRGVTTNRHPGNESFRALVNCNKELYVSSTKKNKMNISRSIVEAVRSKEPTPGRFLEKNSDGTWFDIGDKKAIEKTSQALRDGAAHLRKQLSEDLSDPDFLSAVFSEDNIIHNQAAKNDTKTYPTISSNTKSATTSTSNPTSDKTTQQHKKHRRIQSDPAAILEPQTPALVTPKSTGKLQRNSNNSSLSPSPKLRKRGEKNLMLIKQSNSFNSPMNPARRTNVTPEEPRAQPQGRVLSPQFRTDNPLPIETANTRHRRNHTMTATHNFPDGPNLDANAPMNVNDTLMQDTSSHSFHGPERSGAYHPSSPYMAHSSPVKRPHSPYRQSHPPPHSPYGPPLSPNAPPPNSQYHHSHSPTFFRTSSPYHPSARPLINRTNSHDSTRSCSPYHPPPHNTTNKDVNHTAYQFPIINRSDSHDSYHHKPNNSAYRSPYHHLPTPPPRPNTNAMISNDMFMPDINTTSRYPNYTYNNQKMSFRKGVLTSHPTSPQNYNNVNAHVNKQPLPSPPHLSYNDTMYSESIRIRYNNNSFPNHNHHNNQQNIKQDETSMNVEEDEMISDYDDLKTITPLPFNIDDPINRFQRERTISENTLIGLQHL